jgi:hypothetical protein
MKTSHGIPRALLIAGAAFFALAPVLAAGEAAVGTDKASDQAKEGACLDEAGHGAGAKTCENCTADGVWKAFVEHLKKIGREDLIPREESHEDSHDGAGAEAADAEKAPVRHDHQGKDPIRGVLFQASKEFVNLDALFKEADGKPLAGADLEKARGLIDKLRAGSLAREPAPGARDPFLGAYADYHAMLLDLEAGKHEAARAALESLYRSHHFLPKREVHRHLARAYRGIGDDTLAILEIQFFLLEVPEENEADRMWAKEELKKIREKEHEGPLHDSEQSMRSISTLLAGLDVSQGTVAKERRVEEVIYKTAKLLEQAAGKCQACGASASCSQCSGQCSATCKGSGPGSGQGMASGRGQGKGKSQNPGDGQGQGGANESKELAKAQGQAKLRDLTPDELEAWGRINDREVSRSLRELWDKVPASYRLMVIQYYRDITEPEAEAGPGDAAPSAEK